MSDDIARMTLGKLRVRWGSKAPRAGLPPDAIEVTGMRGEMWLRCDDGTKGEDTTYRLEREWQPGVA